MSKSPVPTAQDAVGLFLLGGPVKLIYKLADDGVVSEVKSYFASNPDEDNIMENMLCLIAMYCMEGIRVEESMRRIEVAEKLDAAVDTFLANSKSISYLDQALFQQWPAADQFPHTAVATYIATRREQQAILSSKIKIPENYTEHQKKRASFGERLRSIVNDARSAILDYMQARMLSPDEMKESWTGRSMHDMFYNLEWRSTNITRDASKICCETENTYKELRTEWGISANSFSSFQ